jgi:hypothetical protein
MKQKGISQRFYMAFVIVSLFVYALSIIRIIVIYVLLTNLRITNNG